MITIARLKETLDYYPDTGVFIWKINANNNGAQIGTIAGYLMKRGYVSISIDGKKYYAHVLAWLGMTGEWPKNFVDHKDTDKANNKWSNLREATKSQNTTNAGLRADNKTGHKGINFDRGKWVAKICVNQKQMNLGRYVEKEAAIAAYNKAAIKFFGQYARVEA